MISFDYQLGSPLIQSLPFAQVLLNSLNCTHCSYCLKRIETDDMFHCPLNECNHINYCSSICQENDFENHRIECHLRLFEKISKRIDNIYNKFESTSQINHFNLTNFFNPPELIEYSLLFFRILKKSKNFAKRFNDEDDCNLFYCKFGNTEHKISFKDLTPMIRYNPKTVKKYDTDLSYYLSNFDTLNKEEIEKLDELVGVEWPGDDYFRNSFIENNVKFTLKNIIDNVIDENFNEHVNSNCIVESDQIKTLKNEDTNKKTNKLYKDYKNDNLFDVVVEDFQKRKIWQKLENSKISYCQLSDYLSNQMCDILKKNQYEKTKTPTHSQESFDRNLNEESDHVFFYDSYRIDDYFSSNLKYDPFLIDKNEEEAINSLKTNIRLVHLESLNQRSDHDNEMDYYFGIWIDEILKLLVDPQISQYFGKQEYSKLEKILYITLRYSVTVTDELSLIPVAKAVYLPLTQIEHSCLPNSSLIFEGNILKVFYFPQKPSTSSKTLKLNLDQIKIDFNHEIFKSDSIDLYILNKLRFLNCRCNRCGQTKKQVHSKIHNLFDQFFEENPNEEMEFSPENEFINNLDFDLDKYSKGSQENNIDQDLFHYDFCLGRLQQANLLYGNRMDLEYSCRIEELLVDTIDSFRRVFGYYHKQITRLLLLGTFCNLTIIKSRRDKIEIFFRFIPLHRYIFESISALKLTYGSDYPWVSIMTNIHVTWHNSITKIYADFQSEIDILLKEHKMPDMSVFFKCLVLQKTTPNVKKIIKKLIAKNVENTEYCYNPYLSADNIDMEPMEECDNLGDEINQNLEIMLQNLNSISDFSKYRFF